MKSAFIGLLLTAAGSLSTACGWALQKQGYNIVQRSETAVMKNLHWWIGFILIAITQPLYLVGISMVNQSTIGVVGPISIIANLLLAKFYLKENIRKWEVIGVLLFIPGCIITLLSASMKNQRYTQQEFNKVFFSSTSMGYLVSNIFCILIGLLLSYFILAAQEKCEMEEDHEAEDSDTSEDSLLNQTSASLMAEKGTVTCRKSTDLPDDILILPSSTESKGNDTSFFSSPGWKILPMICFPYSACFSTSLTMTLSRSLSGFALTDGSGGFTNIEPYIYMGCIGACAIFSYYLLNKALKYFDTMYVVPLFRAFDLYHNILSGGVFLREFGQYSPKQLGVFILGVTICIISILLLLCGEKGNKPKATTK
ncbi:unnamed protein product [Moneuplotes crassus]|uniref:Uncharacterized protein n=1 Tax=Euplotes crassus TaxID=5936 RepID=A0AAD1XID9_EUPCR|nr:unnamed protein product [Moneuplotes crassus]